ncbi:hypothetical protein SteCoe_8512 [Stentor coeruleus]|uniref:3-hydroxyisobutyryl-CoA hydrolase n=1 Tax=Stentor coeruleus TaxID=5963 RepID=A0A1R2CJV4_9CILI|nr:hypothetical protein SteCoe_8512 [Stentor coeruleus]
MFRQCSKRAIANQYIYLPPLTKNTEKIIKNLDLNNYCRGTLGEINFNNLAYGNMLNHSMINSLHRSLMAMELETEIRAIILQSKKDFCLGTDYLYLAHKGRQNSPDAEDYLRKLYALISDISRMETPFIPLVSGRAYGSGAAIAGLGHFSIATENTSACFPEADFGMTPTGGSTFLLGRLPCELGLYLGLTGQKLRGTDLEQVGLAYKTGEHSVFLNDTIKDHVNNHQGPYTTRHISGDAWNEAVEMLAADKFYESIQDSNEIANRTNLSSFWQEKPENMKMTIADVLYNKMVKKDALLNAPGDTYKYFSGQDIQNHLKEFRAGAIEMQDFYPVQPLSIQDYLPAIYRCFSAKTLDEVIDRLTYESHHGEKEWANKMLKNLSQKSALSLELTFHMIRKAYTLAWNECLQQEFKTALNIVKHPDFFEGATKKLNRIKGNPEWISKFPVSKDQVEEMLNNDASLDINAKPYQLLPVKHFYNELPNSPRFWVNEISPVHHYQRTDFELEARSYYNSIGIDLRDHNLEISVVRERFYHMKLFDKIMEDENERMERIAADPLSIKIFYTQRLEEIEKLVNDETRFKDTMQKVLEEHFREKFNERFDLISKRCDEAHMIKKRELFREMRDVVNEEVFLEPIESPETIEKLLEKPEMLNVPMTFPKSNNENYLEPLFNGKYEYTLEPGKYYTADLATTDDSLLYYQTPTEKYGDYDDFNIAEMREFMAETYTKLQLACGFDDTEKSKNMLQWFDEFKENSDTAIYGMFDTALYQKKKKSSEVKNIKPIELNEDSKETEMDEQSNVVDGNLGRTLLIKESVSPDDPRIENLTNQNLFESKPDYLTDDDTIDNDNENENDKIKVPKPMYVEKDYLSKDLSQNIDDMKDFRAVLAEDVYVKTGCKDLKKGIFLLKSGNFEYDTEKMKERRREITIQTYDDDDNYYLSPNSSNKMRQTFTEYFIHPGRSDNNNKLYKSLEIENSKMLFHELEIAKEERNKKKERSSMEEEEMAKQFNTNITRSLDVHESEVPKRYKSFPLRAQFEADYLKIIFGEKTYISQDYEYKPEDLEIPKRVFCICNMSDSPQQWLEKSLKATVAQAFETREKDEMQLTHSELLAYDQDVHENFTPEGMRKLLLKYLNEEMAYMLFSKKSLVNRARQADDNRCKYKKPSTDYQEYLNSSQEYLIMQEADDLSTYARRVLSGKSKNKDIEEVYLKKDVYYDLLIHERNNNLLKGPHSDPGIYLKEWAAKGSVVSERKSYHDHRKRTLADLKSELFNNARLIKNLESLLNLHEYKDKVESIDVLNEILQENKSIL